MKIKVFLLSILSNIIFGNLIYSDLEKRLSALETAIQEKDDMIESLINAPYGIFCAINWDGKRNSYTSVINYDEMTLLSTNLDGPGLNLDSGVFKAGSNGTWSVSFSFLSKIEDQGGSNYIYLYKNGRMLVDTGAGIRYDAAINNFSTNIGRTVYVKLEEGDDLYLKSSWVYDKITHISLCFEFVSI